MTTFLWEKEFSFAFFMLTIYLLIMRRYETCLSFFIWLNKRFAAVHNMIAGDISIDEDLIILISKTV